MNISELTMVEFKAGLEKTRTVILPLGSTEEHGSHLPLDTDTLQAIELAAAVARQRSLFIAPPVHYGVCRSSRNHPGTIGLTTETLKAVTSDIIRDLYRQGLRCFVLLSGHAGGTHMATLVDAGESLLDELPEAQIAVVCEYQLVKESSTDILQTPEDSHAGEIETSRILNAHPQLVKGTAMEEYPDFPQGILVRNKQRYWPGGVWGDPSKATARKGAQFLKGAEQKLNELIDQLESIDDRCD